MRHRIDRENPAARLAVDLSHAIVSALTRREIDLIAKLAQESGRLEQRVMLSDEHDDPEAFLEELFQSWYELLGRQVPERHGRRRVE